MNAGEHLAGVPEDQWRCCRFSAGDRTMPVHRVAGLRQYLQRVAWADVWCRIRLPSTQSDGVRRQWRRGKPASKPDAAHQSTLSTLRKWRAAGADDSARCTLSPVPARRGTRPGYRVGCRDRRSGRRVAIPAVIAGGATSVAARLRCGPAARVTAGSATFLARPESPQAPPGLSGFGRGGAGGGDLSADRFRVRLRCGLIRRIGSRRRGRHRQ